MRFKSLLIVLILALSGSAFWFWRRGSEKSLVYREVQAERGVLETNVLSTGVIKPENRVEVKPPIAGRAERVLVNEGERVRKGQTLVWMSSTERAALLDAARARGAEEVKRWEELYRPTPILAPVSGTVILRQIEPGQTFAPTDPIFVVSDRLIVEANVDETDLAQIRVGQKARIVLDAYPATSIPGEVGTVAFEATTVNNVTTYIVKVIPSETPDFMRSGMTASVSFPIASSENALLVPSEAIQVRDAKAVVLLKSPEGAREMPVQIGMSDGRKNEVLSGIEDDATLLIPQADRNSGKEASPRESSNPFAPRRPGRRGR